MPISAAAPPAVSRRSIEAQLYPADYDGIAAGAPVVNRTHLHAAFVWSRQAAERTPGSVLGHDKLMLLKKAVVAACAPGAGGAASDTFVADPLHCAFDPASLVCKAGDAPDCLTAEQVETVKRFYAGPTNPRTGEQIYPGWPRGSEGPAFGWALEEGDAPFRSRSRPSTASSNGCSARTGTGAVSTSTATWRKSTPCSGPM